MQNDESGTVSADPIDRAHSLLAAGSTATPAMRVVYTAAARATLDAVRARLAAADILLSAAEAELARGAVSAGLPGVT